jgi:hexosaminidase
MSTRFLALTFLFLGLFIACTSDEYVPEARMVEPFRRAQNLIPEPGHIDIRDGQFTINSETEMYADPEFIGEAQLLANCLNESEDIDIKVQRSSEMSIKAGGHNYIIFQLAGDRFSHIEDVSEAYNLHVHSQSSIMITAATGLGAMHGIQTLRQLLGPDLSNSSDSTRLAATAVFIEDYPKFKHRGLLLDCARHFMDKAFVKRYIDLLSYHKMNTLHWHLTEDQGWRIEIKKYPKLTEIGAWRDDAYDESEGERYGGFYTQDDIREIVAYANERHITIIPEIELPGHSQAALAAYPEYSCTGGPFEVETEWGVFREIYCAGNDSTFAFMEDILSEVIDLFPSEYIHIGGDEAPKYRWEHCDKCQKRIADEGLHDAHGLQSYFITRVEKFLNSKGKKLIGWDEILEGGLSPNATVQSWRGMQGGIDAAKSGHDAIMSPTSHCYFDYDLNSIDMEKVYSFDPIPVELTEEEAKHIIGGECNMWSERAPQETIDSKVFPRILALAEVLWTYPVSRDYRAFYQRTVFHEKRLKALGVESGLPTVPLAVQSAINAENNLEVTLTSGLSDLHFTYYWTKAGEKNPEKLTYESPLILSKEGNKALVVEINRGEEKLAEEIHYFNRHKGVGAGLELGYQYSPNYTGGGDNAVCDGVFGSLDFRDGRWQALQKNDLVATVDLGQVTALSEMRTTFYQYNNSWIFLPTKVEFFVSDDGKDFKSVGTLKPNYDQKEPGQFKQEFLLYLEAVSGRYVKIVATNVGHCPDWHDAAGSEAWLFIDEFVIR